MTDIKVGDRVRINERCTYDGWIGREGTITGEDVTQSTLHFVPDGAPIAGWPEGLNLYAFKFDLVEPAETSTLEDLERVVSSLREQGIEVEVTVTETVKRTL